LFQNIQFKESAVDVEDSEIYCRKTVKAGLRLNLLPKNID
jgi:hypothetical protein